VTTEGPMMRVPSALVLMLGLLLVPNAAALNEVIPGPEATFQGLTGAKVRLADFNAKVVLLNFWGTWCMPCLQEIPELVRLARQYRPRGLEVVGVAIDSGRPEDIRAFMAEHGMDYQVLIGDVSTAKRLFRVVGFPTSVLIDREGMIRKRYVGPQTEEVLRRDVAPLL